MIEKVPGIRNPEINDNVNVDGAIGQVMAVPRYNGSGRFTSIVNVSNVGRCYDIVWSDELNMWVAQTYIPERYPDLDGGTKNM